MGIADAPRDEGGERQRGAALAAVLVVMALLLPLGALAVLQARIGLLTQQGLRGDAEALCAAEAAIACTLAQLGPEVDFDLIPRGADGLAGSADDGALPFPLDCGMPLAADVRLESGGPQTLAVVATGRSRRGVTRIVEQRLRRASPESFELGGWRER